MLNLSFQSAFGGEKSPLSKWFAINRLPYYSKMHQQNIPISIIKAI